MNEIKLNKNKKIKLMNMYNKNIHIYKKNFKYIFNAFNLYVLSVT